MSEESGKSEGAAANRGKLWAQPAMRVWLAASTLTLAVVSVVAGAIYYKHDSARVRLEAQYSRLAAHFAEEADLRIESHRRAASVIGGVASWRSSKIARDALATKAADALKGKASAVKVSSEAAQAAKVVRIHDAVVAAVAADAARGTSRSLAAGLEGPLGAFKAATEEQQRADLDVERTAQALKTAQSGARGVEKRPDAGATPAVPVPDEAAAAAARALQNAKEASDTALQKQAQASKVSALARSALEGARTAVYAAQQEEERATTVRNAAFKTLTAAERAAAEVASKQASASLLVEESLEADKNLRSAEERTRLTFLPSPRDCDGSGDVAQCDAQTLAERLFHVPDKALPEVVACPPEAGAMADEFPVLLAGHHALFPIPNTVPRPDVPPTKKTDAVKSTSPGRPENAASATAPDAAPAKTGLCLRVPLDELVPFASGRRAAVGSDGEDLFNEVVLVDRSNCQVLAWSDTDPQARPTTLTGCGSESGPGARGGAEPGADPPKGGPTKKVEDETGKGPIDDVDVSIGGERYRGFRQALRSQFTCATGATGGTEPTPACGPGRALVVVGLVRDGRIAQQVRGLSPITFLLVVALAALSIFSWPVAKLWLIGARSRFGRFDTAFLATSALTGTFIVTLVVLALVARERLTRRLDDQLAAVSTEITTRLDAAMNNAATNLDAFLERTLTLRTSLVNAGWTQPHDYVVPAEVEKSCSTLRFPKKPGTSGRDLQWPHPEDKRRLWPLCEATVPRMTEAGTNGSTAFWVNGGGYEQIQDHDTTRGTPPVNVGARDYFVRARRPCSDLDRTKSPDVAEVVRSLTSTKKILVVARPVTPCTPDPDEQTTTVAGFETNLARFEGLGVTPGIQWAAVDARGRVMLHSSIDEHHGHDFFDDLDDATAAELRAAVAAESTSYFDGEYRGIRNRIAVRPNLASGWSVVALGSRGPNEFITRNTLVATSVTYGVFVLLMVLLVVGFAAYRARNASTPHMDPRPQATGQAAYTKATACLALSCSVMLAGALASPWIPTTLLLFGVMVALVLSASTVPGIWTRSPSSDAKSASGSHVPPAPAASPVPAGSKVPVAPPVSVEPKAERIRLPLSYALCCFAFAAAFVVVPTTICFVGAFSLSAQSALRVEERALVPSAQCGSAGPPCPKRVLHMEPKFDEAPRRSAGLPELVAAASLLWPLEPVLGWFRSDYVPASSDPACRVPGELCQKWARGAPDVELELVDAKGNRTWSLQSEIPHLLTHTNFGHLLLGAGVVALLLLAAHSLAYVSLKRLFFMDILVERNRAKAITEPPQSADPVLFLFPPPEELEKQRGPDVVVLRASDDWDHPAGKILEVREAKLVLAEVDPLRRGPQEFRDRWADALRRFVVFRGPGCPSRTGTPGRTPNPAIFAHEWAISDPDEQRVLAQMALDGQPSPHPNNSPVLRHLAARGLVDDDTLTIADPAFATFLRYAVSPEQMQAWQAKETDVAWDVVRVPLVAGVSLVVGLVAMSHPELAENGVLLLPPVAGGLPAVLRFVAMLASQGKNDEAPG
jgi:hypothetical protein